MIMPTKSVCVFNKTSLLGLGKRNGQYSFGLGEFIASFNLHQESQWYSGKRGKPATDMRI